MGNNNLGCLYTCWALLPFVILKDKLNLRPWYEDGDHRLPGGFIQARMDGQYMRLTLHELNTLINTLGHELLVCIAS